MITIVSIEAGNVIGITIDGKIGIEDIDKITRQVEQQLETYDKLRAYVEVKHLGGIEIEALLKDLKFALKHINHFEKKAVVCDSRWLTQLANVSNKLFPMIEVKCFSWSEQDQAREWVKA
jgi:ribosome maturation factor RimP